MFGFSRKKDISSPSTTKDCKEAKSSNNNINDLSLENNNRPFVEGKDGLIVWEPETNPDILSSIQYIREKFLTEAELNPELYIPRDIEMIKEHDYYIRRFLYPNDLQPEGAFEQFKTWMAWRKEVGFEGAAPTRFPIEFYQIGALFSYGEDREGTLLLYCRFRVYKRIALLDTPIKQFLVYHMDRLDSQARKERGWAVIFDTRGAGIAQIDFDMLLFLVRTVKQYYPWGLKYVLVYELPWILQGGWKITQKLLPQDAVRLFRFADHNSIKEIIEDEVLPDFMGGSCPPEEYLKIPEGCRPAEEVAAEEMGLSPEEVREVKKHFDKFFAEQEERMRKKKEREAVPEGTLSEQDHNNQIIGVEESKKEDQIIKGEGR